MMRASRVAVFLNPISSFPFSNMSCFVNFIRFDLNLFNRQQRYVAQIEASFGIKKFSGSNLYDKSCHSSQMSRSPKTIS